MEKYVIDLIEYAKKRGIEPLELYYCFHQQVMLSLKIEFEKGGKPRCKYLEKLNLGFSLTYDMDIFKEAIEDGRWLDYGVGYIGKLYELKVWTMG